MNKTTATHIATMIFNLLDKRIVEAVTGTNIPPKFLAGLISNECGKDRNGVLNEQATRFEPGVFSHLERVRDGHLTTYGGIVKADLAGASNETLKALATSYGCTQVMGYYCIHAFHCTVADLRNPAKHLFFAVKLLQMNGFPAKATDEQMNNEMRQWNSGSEHGKTFDPEYVLNGKAVRDAYAEVELGRVHRTPVERVAPPPAAHPFAGIAVEDGYTGERTPLAPAISESIKIPATAPAPETPTGNTYGEPPRTEVQPTALKGWQAAMSGFMLSTLTALFTKIEGLPELVQAAVFLGGGLSTAALILGVIWIKNQREERANQKDLVIMTSKTTN